MPPPPESAPLPSRPSPTSGRPSPTSGNDPGNTKMDVNDYIYIDQQDVNKIEFDFEDDDYKIIPFEYKPLNYENYDMDEYGNLDFTEPDTTTQKPVELLSELPIIVEKENVKVTPKRKRKRKKGSRKRRPSNASSSNASDKKKKRNKKKSLLKKRYGALYGPQRRLRFRRPFLRGHHGLRGFNKVRGNQLLIPKAILKKRQDGDTYLRNLKSGFDFNSMVALAGLWVVWNTYLNPIVPTTTLLDVANNIFGVQGRSFEGRDLKTEDFVKMLEKSHEAHEKSE